MMRVLLLLLAGFSLSCTAPRDSTNTQPDESVDFTPIESEDSTDTSSGPLKESIGTEWPAVLIPMAGDGTEPPPVDRLTYEDGPIVVTSREQPGRILLDRNLAPITAELEASPTMVVDRTTWPGRAWQAPLGRSSDAVILNTADNQLTVLSGTSIANLEDPAWGVPTAPRRFLAGVVGNQTALIDLDRMISTPVGGDPRFGGPVLSPGERWIVADAEQTDDGPLVLNVSTAADPTKAVWVYRAPEGMSFVDAGRFLANGKLVVSLRTLEEEPLRLVSYEGEPGEPLEVIGNLGQRQWDWQLPGLIESIGDDTAMVQTADGVATTVTVDDFIGCADGPAISTVTEEQVRFIDRDGSRTTTFDLATRGPVGLSSLSTQHLSIDGYDLHFVPVTEQRAMLVVDCEARSVVDVTDEFLTTDGRFLAPNEGAVSLSGNSAVIHAYAEQDSYLVIVDRNGPRIEALDDGQLRRAFVSPSGERVGIVVNVGETTLLQVRDTATFTVQAEQEFDFGLDSAVFVWTPQPGASAETASLQVDRPVAD